MSITMENLLSDEDYLVVETVRWNDVLEVKKELIGKSYYLERHGGMPITLSSNFQNLDGLVAVIRERSGVGEAADGSL